MGDSWDECQCWGCPRCGQLQPVVVTVELDFDPTDPVSPTLRYAERGLQCIRCGLDLASIDCERAEFRALLDPQTGPMPPTDAEAVAALVDLLPETARRRGIPRAAIAWCLLEILQVADARLDGTDAPHLQLAAQAIAGLADGQAERTTRQEAELQT